MTDYPDPYEGEGQVELPKPKRMKASFPKKAEDLVEEKIFSKRTEEDEREIEVHEALKEQAESLRHAIDPEYASKQRARFLGSMQLEAQWSPANRLKIDRPKNDPMAYRWCHDAVRERVTMENWVPITDMEDARKLCPSAHLRKGEDGRIYSGDSYLAKRPHSEVEQRNAAIYQRSQAMEKAVQEGQVTPGVQNFDRIHSQTSSESDPIGVRYRAKVSDDK